MLLKLHVTRTVCQYSLVQKKEKVPEKYDYCLKSHCEHIAQDYTLQPRRKLANLGKRIKDLRVISKLSCI